MKPHLRSISVLPALASALTTLAVVAGTFGPRALDADGDAANRGEKAQIAAASPNAVRAYARIGRDAASPSGWAAFISAENPSDEAIGVDAELAVSEAVGGEMSRMGPMPRVKFEQKIHLDVGAKGKAEFKVAIPKGKLRISGGKVARSASASVFVASIVRPDGTVVAGVKRGYGRAGPGPRLGYGEKLLFGEDEPVVAAASPPEPATEAPAPAPQQAQAN